jgi:integrase
MATLTKRQGKGGVSWRARVRILGRSVSESFARKTDAMAWISKTESAIREHRYFPEREAGKRSVAELVDRYKRDVVPKKADGEKQGRQLDAWKARLGSLALVDLTPELIAEVRDEWACETLPGGRRRSGATVNRYLAALSHAFTMAAKEWGWITNNPVRLVTRLKESKGVVRWLDERELERLLAACAEGPAYLRPVVLLALGTAMRQSEILGLRWRDIDLERRRLVLHTTKNGERRGVAFPVGVADALRDFGRVRLLEDDQVFPRLTGFRKAWERAIKVAKVDNFRFHDLRHTAASYLAMGGATPSEIAEVTGHKTLQMVKRYAHLSDAHISGVVDRMGVARGLR